MKDDLKKVKGLTHNQELADRVGVAMFMYARNFDLSGEETRESQLARWILQNPMAVDQTMLALVATSTEVLEAATVVEVPAKTGKRSVNDVSAQYVTAEVELGAISDDVISAAVEENWSRVATKGVIPPLTQTEVGDVTVTNGSVHNPFLDVASTPVPKYTERPARE